MDSEILIDKIWNGTISFTEIEDYFNPIKGDKSDFVNKLLKRGLNEKNGSVIDFLIHSIFINGKAKIYNDILCQLSDVRQEWLYKQEDIATLLGEIGDKSSIPHLQKLAIDYPMSDLHSIPLKAMWSLRKIGGEKSIEALNELSNSKEDRKKAIALDQIQNIKSKTGYNKL